MNQKLKDQREAIVDRPVFSDPRGTIMSAYCLVCGALDAPNRGKVCSNRQRVVLKARLAEGEIIVDDLLQLSPLAEVPQDCTNAS